METAPSSSLPSKAKARPRTTVSERLVDIIETFERGVPGVRGSAVADKDGLPVANGFREPLDLQAVTAMSTLALKSSATVFARLGMARPSTVIIEGDHGMVMAYELAGGRASLIALVRPETNLGLLKLEMAVAARKIEAELGFLPKSGGRVEEVLLLARSGLLIGHASVSNEIARDHDIVAGMLTAVQSFVRDLFRKEDETLEEMELAHLRVRLLRGTWSSVAIVASGPMAASYVAHAGEALRTWEEKNEETLRAWKGDPSAFQDVDVLLNELLSSPAM